MKLSKVEQDYLDEQKSQIQRAIETAGPYSHNIVGLCLMGVANHLGKGFANELVDELNLDEIFGIKKVPINGGSHERRDQKTRGKQRA